MQLKSLGKRLSRDTTLKENFAKTISEDLEKGYLIQIPDAHMVEQRSEKEWYQPHQPVIKPAQDNVSQYSEATKAVLETFYMDDTWIRRKRRRGFSID